jgi:ATP-binding cassette subfamily F protein uup
LTFNRESIGIIGKKNGTGKSTFELIDRSLPLDGGKVVIETIKVGYYIKAESTQNQARVLIDVIKEFIPLMKGRMISASQLLERFLF